MKKDDLLEAEKITNDENTIEEKGKKKNAPIWSEPQSLDKIKY